MASITGITGTVITRNCTVSNSGQMIGQSESSATAQSIENDIATIGFGNCTFAGNKRFSGTVDFDNTATANAALHVAQGASLVADGTGANISGVWTWTVDYHIAQTKSIIADGTGCNLSGSWTHSGKVTFTNRKVWDRARGVLTDTDHTIDVTQGDRFEIPDSAAARVITLSETVGSPTEGEVLTFFAKNLTTNQHDPSGYIQWTFKTSGTSNTVCIFDGSSANNAVGTFTWAAFELVSGVWRLAENSGQSYDGTHAYGCLAGVGTHP